MFIFLVLLTFWGGVVVVGVYKRWPFFIDAAFQQKRGRYAIVYVYVIGIGLMVGCPLILLSSLWWK